MNKNPGQIACDKTDTTLLPCRWIIQNKNQINLNEGLGIAVREFKTIIGAVDYTLFADKKPVGITEAKRSEEGVPITTHDDQSEGYDTSKLKYLLRKASFVYESTGSLNQLNH